MRIGAIALLACFVAGSAYAGDGVHEINQACAAGPGCLPSDGPGFPVVIASPGSYRLTSNLTAGTSGAILIAVGGVSIDLAGFTIQMGSSSASAISVSDTAYSDHAVRNGLVRGPCDRGLHFGSHVRVENVTVTGCGIGVSAEDMAQIHRVNASNNSQYGIYVGGGSVISECVADGNGADGIRQASGTVVAVSATNNAGYGGNFSNGLSSVSGSYFAANQGGDVVGARRGGGNYCHDRSCTIDGRRRFYLTHSFFPAASAPGACASGFHFAALGEILDPSGLVYAGPRDGVPIARAEATAPGGLSGGPGPAAQFGWVRTAQGASIGLATAGAANCNAWSATSPSDYGSVVRFSTDWAASPGGVNPWVAGAESCSTNQPVWCVED